MIEDDINTENNFWDISKIVELSVDIWTLKECNFLELDKNAFENSVKMLLD